MVRTRASSAASKAVAAKAPRKAAPSAAPAPKKSKGSKSAGRLPPVTKQPIPEWQRGIGNFFKNGEPSTSKSSDPEEGPASEDVPDENGVSENEQSDHGSGNESETEKKPEGENDNDKAKEDEDEDDD